jgi:hypothetical protein
MLSIGGTEERAVCLFDPSKPLYSGYLPIILQVVGSPQLLTIWPPG